MIVTIIRDEGKMTVESENLREIMAVISMENHQHTTGYAVGMNRILTEHFTHSDIKIMAAETQSPSNITVCDQEFELNLNYSKESREEKASDEQMLLEELAVLSGVDDRMFFIRRGTGESGIKWAERIIKSYKNNNDSKTVKAWNTLREINHRNTLGELSELLPTWSKVAHMLPERLEEESLAGYSEKIIELMKNKINNSKEMLGL